MSTIAHQLRQSGVSRRDFLTFCGKLMVAAPFGLAITDFLTPEAVAQALENGFTVVTHDEVFAAYGVAVLLT